MKTTFINKTKEFEVKFQYNFMISNDFVMKIGLKTLLIIKRMINLSVDVNEDKEIAISLLNISNDRFIINFKSNAFKATAFDKILFKIETKLNKSLTSSSIIIYIF